VDDEPLLVFNELDFRFLSSFRKSGEDIPSSSLTLYLFSVSLEVDSFSVSFLVE
jgi:hypothetical protein